MIDTEEYSHVSNKEALEVYQIGINRKATPLERLKRNFNEFQKRMVLTPAAATATESASPPKVVDKENPKTKSQTTAKISSALSSSKYSSAGPSKGKQKFKVFCDPDSEGKVAPEDVMPTSSSANQWKDYKTEAENRKENLKEATPWAGTTLPQKGRSGVPSQSEAFTVFQDNEVCLKFYLMHIVKS